MDEFMQEYEALTRGVGLVELPGRTLLEITGRDRATFLHNLCTADVRRLQPGEGCEAFFTSVQAKILAHVFLFARPESIVLETVGGQTDLLQDHLERYIIREEVRLEDRGSVWSEVLLSGEGASRLLEGMGNELPSALLAHAAGSLGEVPARLCRVDWTAPTGFLIQFAAVQAAALREALLRAGAVPCGFQAFDAARIERGTPLYGLDIDATHLPQEVARDERAISFKKGCYLGQETVARIDALGHVNRTLCGVRFFSTSTPTPIPSSGTELRSSDRSKAVGQVTSAAFSPRLSAPLALAYLRRGYNTPGTRLAYDGGEAEVVALPV